MNEDISAKKIDKIIDFIDKEFLTDNSSSSILKNYKNLILFFNENKIKLTENDAEILIGFSNKLLDMFKYLFEMLDFNEENVDKNITLLVKAATLELNAQEKLEGNSKYINMSRHYLREISSFPILTKEEELELYNRIKSGDESAKQTLIVHNLKFVAKMARTYALKGYDYDDAIQNGNIGLIYAANNFDATKGYKFSTYASYWIASKINRYNLLSNNLIKYPSGVSYQISKIKNYINSYMKEYGIEPDDEEISFELNIPVDKVKTYKSYKGTLSLDVTMSEEDDDLTLKDLIADDINLEDDFLLKESKEEIVKAVNDALNDELLKEIMIAKYTTPITDKELAEKLGISLNRLRYYIQKGLSKLRRNKKLRIMCAEKYNTLY